MHNAGNSSKHCMSIHIQCHAHLTFRHVWVLHLLSLPLGKPCIQSYGDYVFVPYYPAKNFCGKHKFVAIYGVYFPGYAYRYHGSTHTCNMQTKVAVLANKNQPLLGSRKLCMQHLMYNKVLGLHITTCMHALTLKCITINIYHVCACIMPYTLLLLIIVK